MCQLGVAPFRGVHCAQFMCRYGLCGTCAPGDVLTTRRLRDGVEPRCSRPRGPLESTVHVGNFLDINDGRGVMQSKSRTSQNKTIHAYNTRRLSYRMCKQRRRLYTRKTITRANTQYVTAFQKSRGESFFRPDLCTTRKKNHV